MVIFHSLASRHHLSELLCVWGHLVESINHSVSSQWKLCSAAAALCQTATALWHRAESINKIARHDQSERERERTSIIISNRKHTDFSLHFQSISSARNNSKKKPSATMDIGSRTGQGRPPHIYEIKKMKQKNMSEAEFFSCLPSHHRQSFRQHENETMMYMWRAEKKSRAQKNEKQKKKKRSSSHDRCRCEKNYEFYSEFVSRHTGLPQHSCRLSREWMLLWSRASE